MKTPRLKRRTTNTAIIFAIGNSQNTTKNSALRAARPSLTLFFVVFCFFNFASSVFAQVKITEVMYDAPGADDGREWVEVVNTGSENLDIGKYKFAESGTNHGLKIVAGSSMLAPGGAAIIAADAQKFLADYPAYAGALFDSAFSLSNEGETLAIKNASSSVLDTVSYVAAAQANGTGGTLNRQGENFAVAVAVASPGINPSPMAPVPAAPVKEKASTAKKVASKTAAASPSKNSAKQGSANFSNASQPSDFSNAASLSLIPNISEPVLVGLGLAAAILLGVAGVFFLKQKGEETLPGAEEFTIE
jgi:hypothetical protein